MFEDLVEMTNLRKIVPKKI